MRAAERWTPTKYVERNGTWEPSPDPEHVGPGSQLAAARQCAAYLPALRAHARGDLLDLGCGRVPLYGFYRDLVRSTTCVDWPSTIHPSPHLDHEADLGHLLPLSDRCFDAVLLTDVLEHLPYPDRLWRELRRVLRPGGTVIVGVPFLYWLHEQPHDHHRYTEHRLRLFAGDHGFQVVELAAYGDGTDVLVDILGKMAARTPARRLVGPFQKAAARRPPRPAGPMPLGYVMVARRDGS